VTEQRPTADSQPGSGCPARDELERWLAGQLDAEQHRTIDDHFSGCSACQALAESITEEIGELPSALQSAHEPDEFDEEDACRSAVARASGLVSATSVGSIRPDRDDSTSSAFSPGQTVGSYELLERVGAGGMGIVYRARHTRLEKTVALKLLTPRSAVSAESIVRFDREMQAAGRLAHPNVVTAFDAGEADGIQFLAMEYVDGNDLSRIVGRNGTLPAADACEAIRQAALGLQHVADRGLIHRDLKPSNLLLGRDGVVRILDLGLVAPGQRPVTDEITSTGQVVGTVDYMAPEQASDTRSVDIRADIYSLGATLFRLLTGQSPLAAPGRDTMVSRLAALLNEPPPRLSECRPDLPDALTEIVDQMLSRNPDDRFATPVQVAEALTPFAADADLTTIANRSPVEASDGFSNEAARLQVAVPGSFDGAATVVLPDDSSAQAQPRRRSRLLVTGGILALLAIAAVWRLAGPQQQRLNSGLSSEGSATADTSLTQQPENASIAAEKPGNDLPPESPRQLASLPDTDAGDAPVSEPVPAFADASDQDHQFQIEYDVARRLIERGASIGLRFVNPLDAVEVSMVEELAKWKAEPFYVHSVAGGDRQQLDDTDLEQVGRLKRVSVMGLYGCRNVTNAGVGHLSELPIGHLVLSGTQVTNDCLPAIAQMRNLYYLRLSETAVTPARLERLAPLRSLRILRVNELPEPDQELEQLRTVFPHCQMVAWDIEYPPLVPEEPGLRLYYDTAGVVLPDSLRVHLPLTVEFWLTPHGRYYEPVDSLISSVGAVALVQTARRFEIKVASGLGQSIETSSGDADTDTGAAAPSAKSSPKGGVTQETDTIPSRATPGQRTHLAVTLTESTASLFVDGTLVEAVALNGQSIENSLIRFGRPGNHYDLISEQTKAFRGVIDEARISAGTRYRASFAPEASLPPDETTLAAYSFDEGAGEVVADSSGNGHHGQLQATGWFVSGQ
jgi:serine/threonine protein kinase